MEKNGFTITPESGSNNGEITVVASNTKDKKEEIISIQGGGIIKTVNIVQKGLDHVYFYIQSSDNSDPFRVMVNIVSGDNSTQTTTLVPNTFEVACINNRSGGAKEKTFTEFGNFTETNNFDCDVVTMRYNISDSSKNVRIGIIFTKLTNNANNIGFQGTNPNPIVAIKTLSCIINDTSADRNKRMIVYRKFINRYTSALQTFNPKEPHNLQINDNVITKADGDELRAESVEGKVNVIVIGSQQQ